MPPIDDPAINGPERVAQMREFGNVDCFAWQTIFNIPRNKKHRQINHRFIFLEFKLNIKSSE
jgi:hypothetical protein